MLLFSAFRLCVVSSLSLPTWGLLSIVRPKTLQNLTFQVVCPSLPHSLTPCTQPSVPLTACRRKPSVKWAGVYLKSLEMLSPTCLAGRKQGYGDKLREMWLLCTIGTSYSYVFRTHSETVLLEPVTRSTLGNQSLKILWGIILLAEQFCFSK